MEPLESSVCSPSVLGMSLVRGFIEGHREPRYEFGGSCEARILEAITGQCQNFLWIWSKVKAMEHGRVSRNPLG